MTFPFPNARALTIFGVWNQFQFPARAAVRLYRGPQGRGQAPFVSGSRGKMRCAANKLRGGKNSSILVKSCVPVGDELRFCRYSHRMNPVTIQPGSAVHGL